MKRHFSILVCALVAVAMMFSLASCEALGLGTQHEHTYSGVWSNDATNHWHAATCQEDGCAEAKAAVTAHSDANNDKICDVCAYDMGHEHAYSASWVSNAESHWHVASCGHNVVGGKAAHTPGYNGVCTVCGFDSETVDIAGAIKLGADSVGAVNGGTVNYVYDTYYTITDVVVYKFGDGITNVVTTAYGESLSSWFVMYKDDVLAYTYNEEAEEAAGMYAYSDKNINGYEFATVFGYDDDVATTFYGVEALVSGLYEFGKNSTQKDLVEYVEIVDGENVYTFAYSCIFIDENSQELSYYEVEVSFTLGEKNNFENVYVASCKYLAEEIMAEKENEAGEKVEEGTGIYKPTELLPEVIYCYDVAQTVGERTANAPIDVKDIVVTGFDLVDEEANVYTDITIEAGKTLKLNFLNVAPATANFAISNLQVSVSDKEAVNAEFFDYNGGYITLDAYKAGEYTMTVDVVGELSKTYKVTVVTPKTTELNTSIEVDEGVYSSEDAYDAYIEENGTVSFNFKVGANAYADASCTVVIKDAPAGATVVANEDGTYTFTATATGTYEIVATSTVADGVSTTLTVTLETPPTVAEILNGEYSVVIGDYRFSCYMDTVTVKFTPASEGALNGTCTINVAGEAYNRAQGVWMEYNFTDTYTYSYADGVLTTTLVLSDYDTTLGLGYELSIGDGYLPVITSLNISGGGSAELEPVAPPSAEASVAGEYRYVDPDSWKHRWALVLNADGTGTIAEQNYGDNFVWTTAVSDDLTFTAVANEDGGYDITIDFANGAILADGTYSTGTVVDNNDADTTGITGFTLNDATVNFYFYE